MNDDRIAPGGGFATHRHRDMEIFTYVLSDAVKHKDSFGTRSVIRPGEAQIMSAGTDIMHSEFNHSQTEALYLLQMLQISILVDQQGLTPRYDQETFSVEEK